MNPGECRIGSGPKGTEESRWERSGGREGRDQIRNKDEDPDQTSILRPVWGGVVKTTKH